MNKYTVKEVINHEIDLENKKFQWVEINKQKALFKLNSMTLEKRPCFAEKLANDIAKELEIEAPKTEIIKLNQELGLLSYNFLKEDEKLIMADEFTKSNDIKQIINDLDNKLSNYNISHLERQQIKQNFIKMIVLDNLVSNTDRHNKNWGLIEKQDGKVRLTPAFDFDHSLGLDNVVDEKNDYKKEIQTQEQYIKYKDRKAIEYLIRNNEFARIFIEKVIQTILPEKIIQMVDRFNDKDLSPKYKNMAKQTLLYKIEEMKKHLELYKNKSKIKQSDSKIVSLMKVNLKTIAHIGKLSEKANLFSKDM